MNKSKILWGMSIVQFLAMQIWFNFSAVMPVIEEEWGLTSSQSGIIIAFFHIGYVGAIIFYSLLIDKYNPKYFIVIGALIAGISGIAFAIMAEGFWLTLLLRMISGIGIAGIYVPGMRILTDLFPVHKRGEAVGIYVGSLVVGSGFSLLVSGILIEYIGWQGVIFITSCLSIIGSMLMIFIKIPNLKGGENALKFQWNIMKKVLKKKNLLVNASYAGHSWELYAMWAWIGPFLVYYFGVQGLAQTEAIRYGNITGALVIMVGGIATYVGGKLSDQFGHIKVANFFLIISISCSLMIGWLDFVPMILMFILLLIYGFSIVADSPIYNVAITNVSDPEVIGLALGVQSVIGFTVTIFSPMIFGFLLQSFSWGIAFTVIGLVTIVSPICMLVLKGQKD
ncbi:MFS transporter [Solibacillus sp. A46]|uniref:MFS transporter n=1 Tax=Solibacillus faecavium TaxID=2762221 RepID=A0ABR8XVS8_9BACL|nr:MFS transporter [Solibacillus faecavium]MBD8036044.1 MFS transporter [Solibacillus faecavium]